MKRIAFIGLGVMGSPMAGHLTRAGHHVTVCNRSPEKAARWVQQHGGQISASPKEAALGADCVIVCVGDDGDVEEVVAGEQGALQVLSSGSLIIDHTTTSADLARRMARQASERGVGFVDAPVSGGQIGAERGALTIMAGGEQRDFNAAEPVMAAYSKKREWFGPSGSGQVCKMVNQILLCGLIQGLSEGVRFAQKSGLDIQRVVETLRHGAAQSWQLENRALTMAEGRFDFGFAVDLMLKDLGIAEAQAQAIGANLPVTRVVRDFYRELSASGGGRLDTSSLIKRL